MPRGSFASQTARKLVGSGHFFEGLMHKNGTPLWREAHLQVNVQNTCVLAHFAAYATQ